jgi:glycosyltransferase involved in cell wall biosynthesis
MRVLISAYAARAGHGSEPGAGWGWARHLAEAGHDVTLLTHLRNEPANEAWRAQHRLDGLQVAYIAGPLVAWEAARRRMPLRPARLAAYCAWQEAALRRARRLHDRAPFDVVHHVTYGSIILGSPLWRLGIPLVLGPVGSGQRVPAAARPLFATGWYREQLRNGVVAATAAHLNPLAGPAVRRAAAILATNAETMRLARGLGARDVSLMCDTGVDADRVGCPRARPPAGRRRQVVWVGRLEPLKALRLAVDAVAETARRVDLDFHVVGLGPQRADLERWVADLDIGERTHLHGWLRWPAVLDLYAASDVLLFTSVRESFGSQLVEAAASGLPLVAIDLHGVASILPDDAASKVPLAGVPATVAGLSAALTEVLTDGEAYERLSAGAVAFARSETWPVRVERVERVYARVTRAREAARPTSDDRTRPTVRVAMLTYKRPDDLPAAVQAVAGQLDDADVDASLLVVDNDPEASALPAAADHDPTRVRFVHEPEPGIAAGRNRALDESGDADALVFIDDDERPQPGWLRALVATWERTGATAVVGPVISTFPHEPEPWIAAGGFFERRRPPSGTEVTVAASNNLLLDLGQLRDLGLRFDRTLGMTGADDTLLTRQIHRGGGRMVWCDEARVVDVVPTARLNRRWVVRRAFRMGNSWSLVALRLESGPVARLAERLRLTARGVVRVGGGAARMLLGVATQSVGHRARGARTLARGLGMTTGAWGYVYAEYRRPRGAR